MQIPPASVQALAGQVGVSSRAPASQSQQATESAARKQVADQAVFSSASQEDVAELTGDGTSIGERDADGREAWQRSSGTPREEQAEDEQAAQSLPRPIDGSGGDDAPHLDILV